MTPRSPTPMLGATSATSGRTGIIPAPVYGEQNRALIGAGQWFAVPIPWQLATAYAASDLAIINGGMVVRANGTIAANTPFAWGTTGATWSPVLPSTFTWRGVYTSGTAYSVDDVAVSGTSMVSPLMVCVTAHTAIGALNGTARGVGYSTTGCMALFIGNTRTSYSEVLAVAPNKDYGGAIGLLPAGAAGSQDFPLRGGGVPRQTDYALFTPSANITGVVANTILPWGNQVAYRGGLGRTNVGGGALEGFILKAGRAYDLSAGFSGDIGANGNTEIAFYNVTSASWLGARAMLFPTSGSGNGMPNSVAAAFLAPTSDATVQVRCYSTSNAATIYSANSWVKVVEVS